MSLLNSITITVLDWNTNVIDYIIRVLAAALGGFLIGYERKTRSKEAGVRTHTIVAVGAAIMMVVSKYGFGDTDGHYAAERIAAQIVSGIGFLGAGIIFYKRDTLHGLTTAAGIWATAGIGMAFGAGLYVIGSVAAIIVVGSQLILHLPFRAFKGRTYKIIKAVIAVENEETISLFKQLLNVDKFLKFKTFTVDGQIRADIEVNTLDFYEVETLYKIISENPFIISLEKIDEM